MQYQLTEEDKQNIRKDIDALCLINPRNTPDNYTNVIGTVTITSQFTVKTLTILLATTQNSTQTFSFTGYYNGPDQINSPVLGAIYKEIKEGEVLFYKIVQATLGSGIHLFQDRHGQPIVVLKVPAKKLSQANGRGVWYNILKK